jgi:malate synthase
MAAQIPVRSDPARNHLAFEKVRADKRREAADGHDGTWVAHPGLVAAAAAEFDAVMPGLNQIHRLRNDVTVTADDLLRVPAGTITERGLRQNVHVGVRYLEAWLRGVGCVPLNDLMEDAATAEISRAQIWQWIRHEAFMTAETGEARRVDAAAFRAVLGEEVEAIRSAGSLDEGNLNRAAALFARLAESSVLEDFLTVPAYDLITSSHP